MKIKIREQSVDYQGPGWYTNGKLVDRECGLAYYVCLEGDNPTHEISEEQDKDTSYHFVIGMFTGFVVCVLWFCAMYAISN